MVPSVFLSGRPTAKRWKANDSFGNAPTESFFSSKQKYRRDLNCTIFANREREHAFKQLHRPFTLRVSPIGHYGTLVRIDDQVRANTLLAIQITLVNVGAMMTRLGNARYYNCGSGS